MNTQPLDYINMLDEFHRACGYNHSPIPSVDDRDRVTLWTNLLREEVGELLEALESGNLVAVADGIGDSLYVLFGMSLAFGIPIQEVFSEIHASNLSKIKRGTTWRPDGKVLRSDDYRKPDIRGIIERRLRLQD